MSASVRLDHGTLRLRSLGLKPRGAGAVRSVRLEVDGKPLAAAFDRREDQVTVRPASPIRLAAGHVLTVFVE